MDDSREIAIAFLLAGAIYLAVFGTLGVIVQVYENWPW